ncbi:hypothetical protein [Ruminococcus albus]|uniref:Uncharacterized protein n=1 Tax=Ruminococcus albus TaxID=1264 RepID=A0A1H7GC67_RUMAL|nr:hypothetical protein [Ruminococcus albus]SEK35719.1 hypothetical protein SAMN05216469_10250 [Ruminococcus albus]
MRKFFRALLAGLSAAVMLGSCGETEDKAGGLLVKQAREDYASLNSAKVIMTNIDSGEEEQCFTFKYDEKDTLVYSYYGKSDNSEYAQFNNGLECFTYENGEVKYSVNGDADFVRYTRKMPHPQADEGLLIYTPKNITSAKEETIDGGIKVTHVYDPQKIGAKVEDGEVTGFTAEYYFDNDGKLEYFTETTTSETDGKEQTYAYRVDITEKNSVGTVENTVNQFMNDKAG